MIIIDGSWENYRNSIFRDSSLGLMFDYSRMWIKPYFFTDMEVCMQRAYRERDALEQGGVANPDEKRMVGHYWLRNPELAPRPEISRAILDNIHKIKEFAGRIRKKNQCSPQGRPYTRFLLIGIGGSALGPQLVSRALGEMGQGLRPEFMDNTDPDGMDRIFTVLDNAWAETLVLVASKSGGTVETRNGMLEVRRIFCEKGLDFARQAIALTTPNSNLDQLARSEDWLECFPVWDWVGGRTSLTSSVGLLPAALQGVDIDALLAGARQCDIFTRRNATKENPAALLALAWYYATTIEAKHDMVILPYKDSLEYLPRYLQQLVMESLGKEKDLESKPVHQGIAVYGNKGSTDQHAYVQQLLDGVNNFFVTFIEVVREERENPFFIERDITSGDYLRAFLQGTREALTKNGRKSLTITLERLDAFSLGVLIALFERAVSYYAGIVSVNAYHQPGVELGKISANRLIKMQTGIIHFLRDHPGQSFTSEETAMALSNPQETEDVFKILEYLSQNRGRHVTRIAGDNIFASRYEYKN